MWNTSPSRNTAVPDQSMKRNATSADVNWKNLSMPPTANEGSGTMNTRNSAGNAEVRIVPLPRNANPPAHSNRQNASTRIATWSSGVAGTPSRARPASASNAAGHREPPGDPGEAVLP